MRLKNHVSNVRQHHKLLAKAFRSNPSPTSREFTDTLRVNQCGECSMCCELPAISEQQYKEGGGLACPPKNKEFGKKCELLGCNGCTQYDNRPDICHGYLCFYALGISNELPSKSGVAWSLEMDKETMSSWVVIGHCYDCDVMSKVPSVMADAIMYQCTEFAGLKVSYVVLRSVGKGIRMSFNVDIAKGESTLDYSAEKALLHTGMEDMIVDIENIELSKEVLTQAVQLLTK